MERGKINNRVKKFGLVKKISIKLQHKYKSVKTTIHLLRGERTPTWLGRSNTNMYIDGNKRFPGDTSLSDIRKMYSYVKYKRLRMNIKNHQTRRSWTNTLNMDSFSGRRYILMEKIFLCIFQG